MSENLWLKFHDMPVCCNKIIRHFPADDTGVIIVIMATLENTHQFDGNSSQIITSDEILIIFYSV